MIEEELCGTELEEKEQIAKALSRTTSSDLTDKILRWAQLHSFPSHFCLLH